MFGFLFEIIINMLATLIQIVVWPINLIIENALPDLTSKISEVSTTLSTVFDGIGWALGLVPSPILVTLSFIIGVEIAKHTVFTSTHVLIKVWNIFQKIKFW